MSFGDIIQRFNIGDRVEILEMTIAADFTSNVTGRYPATVTAIRPPSSSATIDSPMYHYRYVGSLDRNKYELLTFIALQDTTKDASYIIFGRYGIPLVTELNPEDQMLQLKINTLKARITDMNIKLLQAKARLNDLLIQARALGISV